MTDEQIEARLASLLPIEPKVDRDQLMYRVGFEAGIRSITAEPVAEPVTRRPTINLWQATTGAMTAATVVLAVMLARQPSTSDSPAMVRVDSSVAPAGDGNPLADPLPAVAVLEFADVQTAPIPAYTPPAVLGDPSTNYLALRAAVLARGLDAWPFLPDRSGPAVLRRSDDTPPPTIYQLREEYLPRSSTPPEKEATDESRDESPAVPTTQQSPSSQEESLV